MNFRTYLIQSLLYLLHRLYSPVSKHLRLDMADFRSRSAIKNQYRIARSVKELKVPCYSEFPLVLPLFHVIPFIESKFSSKLISKKNKGSVLSLHVFFPLKVVGHQKRSLPTTVLTTQTCSGLLCLVNCEIYYTCVIPALVCLFWGKEPLTNLAQHAGVRRFVVVFCTGSQILHFKSINLGTQCCWIWL